MEYVLTLRSFTFFNIWFISFSFITARVEFTAFNESSTSIRLKWESDIPIPIDDSQEDGLKIDYRPADSTAERSRLFCGGESTYLFSNLTAFTNYCFNLVGFNKGEIITKINNSQCVYTDEEGRSLTCFISVQYLFLTLMQTEAMIRVWVAHAISSVLLFFR